MCPLWMEEYSGDAMALLKKWPRAVLFEEKVSFSEQEGGSVSCQVYRNGLVKQISWR